RARFPLRHNAGRPPGPASPPSRSMSARIRGFAQRCLSDWSQAITVRSFRATCVRLRSQLYHEPNHIPLPCDLPTVATVHDLSALPHPEWHPATRAARFADDFRRGLARCQHILAVSEFTRQEVICSLGFSPQRVTRTYNGIRTNLQPLPREVVGQELARLGLP